MTRTTMRRILIILLLITLTACSVSIKSKPSNADRPDGARATVEAVSPLPAAAEAPRGTARIGGPICTAKGNTRFPIVMTAPADAPAVFIIDLDNERKIALHRQILAGLQNVWYYTVLAATKPDTVVTVRQNDAVLASIRAKDLCR